VSQVQGERRELGAPLARKLVLRLLVEERGEVEAVMQELRLLEQ